MGLVAQALGVRAPSTRLPSMSCGLRAEPRASAGRAVLRVRMDASRAGARLVMLVDSMIPEATEKSGRVAGLATTLGFGVAAGRPPSPRSTRRQRHTRAPDHGEEQDRASGEDAERSDRDGDAESL